MSRMGTHFLRYRNEKHENYKWYKHYLKFKRFQHYFVFLNVLKLYLYLYTQQVVSYWNFTSYLIFCMYLFFLPLFINISVVSGKSVPLVLSLVTGYPLDCNIHHSPWDRAIELSLTNSTRWSVNQTKCKPCVDQVVDSTEVQQPMDFAQFVIRYIICNIFKCA